MKITRKDAPPKREKNDGETRLAGGVRKGAFHYSESLVQSADCFYA
jgi:hypothetical protein